MASYNETLIILLNNITQQLNRYISIVILTFGVIGNLLNIIILLQRSLRSNPCALFFNASSIAGLIAILFGVPTRIMAGWSIDPTDTISWLCKIRTFFLYTARTSFLWFILFATVDRWLSSCVDVRRRQMSTLKNAKRNTIVIIFFSVFINVFLLYCYDANQVGGPTSCYGQTMVCRLVTDLIYAVVVILVPLGLMLVFGLLIVLNIRRTRIRVQDRNVTSLSSTRTPTMSVSTGQARRRKEDRQVLIMLLGQVIILFVLISPHAVQKLYTTFFYNPFKSEVNTAIDDFFYSSVIILTFLANGMPFYVYTLTGGNIFRNELFNIFKTIQRKMKCIH